MTCSLTPGLFVCIPCWRFCDATLKSDIEDLAKEQIIKDRQEAAIIQIGGPSMTMEQVADFFENADFCPWCMTTDVTRVT